MKKIKYLLILMTFALLLTGCFKEKKAEEKTNSTPLLYEVTKEGKDNKLYLFGSIHAADESLYPLPTYVEDAFNRSDAVAVEFDLVEMTSDLQSQVNYLTKFTIPDNKTIKELIKEETYTKAVDILKNASVYNSLWDYYNPMMWYSLIETASMKTSELKEDKGIDLHFLNKAKEDKKDIIELESADFQYEMLLGFDEKTQIYILEQSVESYDESVENLKKLFELYKKGNRSDLEELLINDIDENDEYEKIFNDKLITSRNIDMTKSLDNYFKEGKNIFCTVGLAHIIGKEGIAESLKERGYKVEEIS